MANKKKIGIGCLIGVIVIVLGVSIYGMLAGKEDVQELVEVERYTIPTVENIFVNGTVAPKEVETFGMNMSLGSVETVHVKDGEKVSVGDTIVTYKRDGVGEQIEALQAQVEAVRKAKNSSEQSPSRQGDMSREAQLQGLESIEGLEGLDLEGLDLEGLGSAGDISSMDYDAQISSLESQIKKLREMETSVETSGIDGIAYIENTTVQEGISVERVVVRSEEFVAVGSVNEKNVLKLSEGMSAEITLLANDIRVDGEIESVGQRPGSGGDIGSIDINSAMAGGGSGGDSLSSYDIVFKLKDQVELLEGFSVQARIPLDDDSIIIPESAIGKDGDEQYVYVIKDGLTERVVVEAVLSSDLEDKEDQTEGDDSEQAITEELDDLEIESGKALIVSGLGHGDEIVVSDISSLAGGERVE